MNESSAPNERDKRLTKVNSFSIKEISSNLANLKTCTPVDKLEFKNFKIDGRIQSFPILKISNWMHGRGLVYRTRDIRFPKLDLAAKIPISWYENSTARGKFDIISYLNENNCPGVTRAVFYEKKTVHQLFLR
jgi:hypothetical protein